MTDYPNSTPDVLIGDLRQRADDHLSRAARYASPTDTMTAALLGCGYALCALYDQRAVVAAEIVDGPDEAEARAERLAFEEWGPA
ncbi:hypothetical protein [Saccharopolyspora phatthalungensis]|uniref:Uncharacterized protein n=1 Tax=Saccharopolyspora phatthalungensis TaxID=664693 RepID=A0A840Q8G7_9PSEU|nr:hypothetical protein [Saccharopolyspora phatthalungensis]MBB5154988.1 hypothetical protein [Saccharopolyspora phatthalungensis]